MKLVFSCKFNEKSIKRFRALAAEARGTQDDLFADMLDAYEDKHRKKSIFGLKRKSEGK